MFGKKHQIIKYDARAYTLVPGESEPLFVRLRPVITDLTAKIEVPVNHFAFILKSGDYGQPIGPGISDVFSDKNEAKNFKKGI